MKQNKPMISVAIEKTTFLIPIGQDPEQAKETYFRNRMKYSKLKNNMGGGPGRGRSWQ